MSSNLQDRADSRRGTRSWFCCCNFLRDRAAVPTTPGGSNDLRDIRHPSALHPVVWGTGPPRDRSTLRHTGLLQHSPPGTDRTGGRVDPNPPDRRNLPGIFQKAPRAPRPRSSNRGDIAGNPPEKGNEERKNERGRKRDWL
ncbi:hypothetical protein EYF80_043243 [Liparis tanakae]|uniref:Uncharacterized protein n=1 Tax=Liparis tanakae TaxID=230148 RepID=A0A4Z2FZ89_9TELE|nr:hypothetical protein EYF80_043243 [Liparis tanakae]